MKIPHPGQAVSSSSPAEVLFQFQAATWALELLEKSLLAGLPSGIGFFLLPELLLDTLLPPWDAPEAARKDSIQFLCQKGDSSQGWDEIPTFSRSWAPLWSWCF